MERFSGKEGLGCVNIVSTWKVQRPSATSGVHQCHPPAQSAMVLVLFLAAVWAALLQPFSSPHPLLPAAPGGPCNIMEGTTLDWQLVQLQRCGNDWK